MEKFADFLLLSGHKRLIKLSKTVRELDKTIDNLAQNPAEPETIRQLNSSLHEFYQKYTSQLKKITWPASKAVTIKYEGSDGEISTRQIDIMKVHYDMEHGYSIYAYCHYRDEPRTFKVSRMENLIDKQTGEVFKNPIDFFDKLTESIPPDPVKNRTKRPT